MPEYILAEVSEHPSPGLDDCPLASKSGNWSHGQVGSPAGIEQPKSSRRKTRGHDSGDVRSDVVDRRTAKAPSQIDPEAIADLASRLASLPPEALAALQALFGGQP